MCCESTKLSTIPCRFWRRTYCFGWLEMYTERCAFGFLAFPAFLFFFLPIQHPWWAIDSCVSFLYRPLEAVGGAPVSQEHQEIPSRGAEPQVLHSTSEQPGPLPTESGVLKKVILHFWYLAPWNKHFNELRLCKVTTVWLRNTYLKRR